MERDPHALVEGMIVAGLALNSEQGYIYLRGEFAHASRQLAKAIRQAYAKGYLGADVMGSGKRYDLTLHRAAGAYICGEETALLDSLEGRRGQPRLRPPFPAVQGLFGCPTTVNNVESIAMPSPTCSSTARLVHAVGDREVAGHEAHVHLG
jgi:NADH-quinone oxidoreductase subunit F